MNNLVFPAAFRDNIWRKPGDVARYARLSTIDGSGKGIAGPSDGDYVDGSYIRLNNVQLRYAFPDKMLKKAGMTSCYFSIIAQNIFTITKYKGIDPEIADLSTLPRARMITANLSVTF